MSQHQKPLNGRIPALPREVRDNCRALFEAGKTPAEIASETGAKPGTIRAWVARAKWRRGAALTATQSDPLDELPDLETCREQYEGNMARYALAVSDHAATLEGEAAVRQSDKLLKADQISRKVLKIETDRPPILINLAVLAAGPPKRESERLRSLVRPQKPHELPAIEAD